MRVEIIESYQGEFELPDRELEQKFARALEAGLHDLLKATYQSHTDEPSVGDKVRNVNTKCKHYRSEGVVTAVKSLPGGKGTTVQYRCTNDGPAWNRGDTLEKTLDQLAPRVTKALRKAHDHDHDHDHDHAYGGEIEILKELTGQVVELYQDRLAALRADLRETFRET